MTILCFVNKMQLITKSWMIIIKNITSLHVNLNGISDTVFGILMILFAGGWSDKKGKRKPCMLLPLIGETASLFVLLISAIFMVDCSLDS